MTHLLNLKSARLGADLYKDKDAVVVLLPEGCDLSGDEMKLAPDVKKALLHFLSVRKDMAEAGSVFSAYLPSGKKFVKLIAAGAGKLSGDIVYNARRAAGNAARALFGEEIREAAVVSPLFEGDRADKLLYAAAEGFLLGAYRFERYKTDAVKEKKISVSIASSVHGAAALLKRASVITSAVAFARDLDNEPGNSLTPEVMAEEAAQIAEEGGMEIKVLDERDMSRLGMNALLSVGQGSTHPPRLIMLKYKNGGNAPFTALVGKGITFDSGGISIKPSEDMDEMKDDMSGAAAVLAAMKAVAELDLKVNVLGILSCAENMPSGNAQRPGDIVKAASGKTIEVISTDAEGRMVLADAVWYAGKMGAAQIIDIATLTGAVIIALGEHCSAIIANDDDLSEKIVEAGKAAGEKWWRLPCLDDCARAIRGHAGDLKNSAGRAGGVITGGIFIGEFVEKGIPWAHLDIGGTSTAKETDGHIVKGCTGFGTATLIEFLSGK